MDEGAVAGYIYWNKECYDSVEEAFKADAVQFVPNLEERKKVLHYLERMKLTEDYRWETITFGMRP